MENVGLEILSHVPNSFTPNGDEHNNTFYIPVEGWSEYNMVIFDFVNY